LRELRRWVGQVEQAGFCVGWVGVEVPVEVCERDGCDERRAVAGFCGRDWEWEWWSDEVVVVVVLLLVEAAAAMIVIRIRIDQRSLCSLV
jgi:hypothetical protein